jgi:hypothetical protein
MRHDDDGRNSTAEEPIPLWPAARPNVRPFPGPLHLPNPAEESSQIQTLRRGFPVRSHRIAQLIKMPPRILGYPWRLSPRAPAHWAPRIPVE